MSVLITGMKMPENCKDCPFRDDGFCLISPPYFMETFTPEYVGRAEWCPLVEVVECKDCKYWHMGNDLAPLNDDDSIYDAPTIVEEVKK